MKLHFLFLCSLVFPTLGFHLSHGGRRPTNFGSHVYDQSRRLLVGPLQAKKSSTESPSSNPSLHASAAALLVGASLVFSPIVLAAHALETTTPDVTILNHEYTDPLHPQCRRTINVDGSKMIFHYSGTTVGSRGKDDDSDLRGCSPAEVKKYGIRGTSFDGTIQMPGLRLSAGDGIHEGQWEPANSVPRSDWQYRAVDGIRWQDGNKWIVKEEVPKPLTTVIGEWIFLAYIGFSTLAGVKGVYDKVQERMNKVEN